jgi:hypothetical protein
MKTKLRLLCLSGLLVALTRATAATLYVDAASTNAVSLFASWATAAANIQDAVDAAAPGDEILVTNGVYQTGARSVYGMSNRVAVTKAVAVRSVNGPQVTSIVGSGPNGPTAVRCFYLANAAVLAGFTLTNGATFVNDDPEFSSITNSGGGVLCESQSAVVTNCVLAGNSAYGFGGGAYSGTLNHCTLSGNSAFYGGGAYDATLNHCMLTTNSAYCGGGSYNGMLNTCAVTGNTASEGGGAFLGTLNNCTLSANTAFDSGGVFGGTLNNCTVCGNSAFSGGGASSDSDGVFICTLNNCIVYYNSGESAYGVDDNNYYRCVFNYSCTTPDPGSGVGNITNAPLFVDTNGWSNLRLASNSPCSNAGNNAYVTTSTDLDGRPRIVNGTVDMGAYEWQVPVQYARMVPPGTGGMALNFTGEPNRVYGLYGTTNLLDWFWLAGVTNLTGPATYTDPLLPPPPRRFYKAVPLP